MIWHMSFLFIRACDRVCALKEQLCLQLNNRVLDRGRKPKLPLETRDAHFTLSVFTRRLHEKRLPLEHLSRLGALFQRPKSQ